MNENNEIIYCKEQHIPTTKTRKKFLKDVIEERPTTYKDVKGETIQCYSDKNRSVSELLSIVRSRFPKTSLKAIVRILDELNADNRCHMIWCNTVNKFVIIANNRDNGNIPFMSNYSVNYYKDTVGTDGISYNNLMQIRQNIHDEKNK